MFVKKMKKFVDWFINFYWAAAFVWFVSLLKIITGRKTGTLSDIQDWVVVIGGGFFIVGILSHWSRGSDGFIQK